MQHLQPNTTLQGGKYRIEKLLGQGGFGNTYVGCNTGFDERIAIKEFFLKGVTERDETTSGISVASSDKDTQRTFQEQKEKFRKEAKRLCKLRNSHIISVHDLFEENGTMYYVMDYIDGENLSERLKRTGTPLTEQEVWNILPQVLDALAAAHAEGLLHLDIKPSNIMIDRKGNVLLIDFGASKQMDDTGRALTGTAVARTPGYAPREQMEQSYSKMGPWTDIYALGATLYALLTNKRPPMPSDIDDDDSVDKHEAMPLSNGISSKMHDLIIRMMDTNRNRRPQSVQEVKLFMEGHNYTTKSTAESIRVVDTEDTAIFEQSTQDTQEKTIFDSESCIHEETQINYKPQNLNKKKNQESVPAFINEDEKWHGYMNGEKNTIIGAVSIIAAISFFIYWMDDYFSILWGFPYRCAISVHFISYAFLFFLIYKYFCGIDKVISCLSLISTCVLTFFLFCLWIAWSYEDVSEVLVSFNILLVKVIIQTLIRC